MQNNPVPQHNVNHGLIAGLKNPLLKLSASLASITVAILTFLKSELFDFCLEMRFESTTIQLTSPDIVIVTSLCALLLLSNVYIVIDTYLDNNLVNWKERLKDPSLTTFIFGWFLLFILVGLLGGGALLFISAMLGFIFLTKTLTIKIIPTDKKR